MKQKSSIPQQNFGGQCKTLEPIDSFNEKHRLMPAGVTKTYPKLEKDSKEDFVT